MRRLLSVTNRMIAFLVLLGTASTSAGFSLFVPLGLGLLFILQWRWHFGARVNVLIPYILFYAVPIFYGHFVPAWLVPLSALPFLFILNGALEDSVQNAPIAATGRRRSFSALGLELLITTPVLFILSILLGSWSLAVASTMMLVYQSAISAFVLVTFPEKPVIEKLTHLKVRAGTTVKISIVMSSRTQCGGRILISSDEPWIKITPADQALGTESVQITLNIAPPLSGTRQVTLYGRGLDRWGIFWTRFQIIPIDLVVFPRVKYAAWLAKKYLSGTLVDFGPFTSNSQIVRGLLGPQRGVEYFGSQPYRPGDSLKQVDWKHLYKCSEMVSKQYRDQSGKPVVMLINLVASDFEQADRLARDMVMYSLALAIEGIPTSIGAYDDLQVRHVTHPLNPNHLVAYVLRLVDSISVKAGLKKFMKPPDLLNMSANINRLRGVASNSALILMGILKIERANLIQIAKTHPASTALRLTQGMGNSRSAVLVISGRNHDAEALAVYAGPARHTSGALIEING